MKAADEPMTRKAYEKALRNLQVELCALQEWVKEHGLRVIVVCFLLDSSFSVKAHLGNAYLPLGIGAVVVPQLLFTYAPRFSPSFC